MENLLQKAGWRKLNQADSGNDVPIKAGMAKGGMASNAIMAEITAPRAVLLPWWTVQLLGWMLYCIVSFLSLTLWYGNPQWLHVVQILLEALLGAALTQPLGLGLKYAARGPLALRLITHMGIIATIALIWNVMRMYIFAALFPGANIWEDFGGWYFASFLIFALWSALFYGIRTYSAFTAEQERALNEKMRRITAESLSRDAQLQMLRYQINPHFIFNTMNSINALVATDRSREARNMIEQFSSFLRITLEGDKTLFVTLAEEIDTIKSYLAVEKMRFHERLQLEIDIADDLSDISVPSLILQPIVENAVRHGVEGQRKAVLIKIKAKAVDEHLILTITNDGPILKYDNDRKEGVGLQNVRSRLDTVYQGNYEFTMRDNRVGSLSNGSLSNGSLSNGQTKRGYVEAMISIPLYDY